MKLLIDMNLSPRWVDLFTEAGIEAAHWSVIGSANAPDSELMAFATSKGYVLLTQDLDFSAMLAAAQGDKPSVIQIRSENLSPDVIGPAVIAAMRRMSTELEEGALVTVDPNRARLRVLPLLTK